jgi:3-hydroxyacyl-[acyl-carrier-protein] dehydratase
MKISKENIQYYIPQRAPFIMIDNLVEASEEKFETDFLVTTDNIFLEEGILREFALIENIAQSSAAGLGYINSSSKSGKVEGFIGAISKLTVYGLPKIHDTIQTIVTPLYKFENIYLLKGENYVGGKKLLECELKLVGGGNK